MTNRSSSSLCLVAGSCFLAGVCCSAALLWALQQQAAGTVNTGRRKQQQQQLPRTDGVCDGVLGTIGNTALIRIASLSEETGCEIYGKAEFLNPGGSVKDRVALQVVKEALESGQLRKGDLITEGTAGSTGISLAMVAAALGCRCFIAMPDDAAVEKVHMLQALGAEVQRVRPVSIAHPDHHVNVARRKAAGTASVSGEAAATATSGSVEAVGQAGCRALFADQFENLANYRAHLQTGEEIWQQTGGRLHAFVSGAGTGGTIAGVSARLLEHDPSIQILLIDPPGSSLYNKVTRGVMYTFEEAEGKRLRNPFDTITEGIGINRLTQNFKAAHVHSAFKGSDREAVEMASYLLRNDGLFLGSSAAMNCVGAVKAARLLGPGHTIVTILCDGGQRHLSKFHSPEYLRSMGLEPKATGRGLDFVL